MNQSQLIALLQYSQDTGIFEKPANAGSRGRKIGGYIVGCKNTIGYVVVSINKKKYYAHRLAWFYVHGEWPEHHIDHINGDRSDNRISNLRKSTNSENMQNIKGPRVDNKFNLLGVCYDKQKKKFLAQIRLNGKNKYLGRFDNPDLAHEAYMAAKRKFHEFNTI